MTRYSRHRGVSEEDDAYAHVLWQGRELRVIACRHGLQWIVQRRRRALQERGAARWSALGYCATRTGLTRLSHALSGADGHEFAAWAAGQPDAFPRKGGAVARGVRQGGSCDAGAL